MGVPSRASRSRSRIRRPSTASTSTVCRPIGFGRSAERVLNTPRSGLAASSRGWTRRTSRRRAIEPGKDDEPVARRDVRSASATELVEREPCVRGALAPCFGAEAGSVSDDSTLPIGVSSTGSGIGRHSRAWRGGRRGSRRRRRRPSSRPARAPSCRSCPPNSRLPSPRTTGNTISRSSSTRSFSSRVWTRLALPWTTMSPSTSSWMRATSAATSPLITVGWSTPGPRAWSRPRTWACC